MVEWWSRDLVSECRSGCVLDLSFSSQTSWALFNASIFSSAQMQVPLLAYTVGSTKKGPNDLFVFHLHSMLKGS